MDFERRSLIEGCYLPECFGDRIDSLILHAVTTDGVDRHPGDEYEYEPLLVERHINSVSQLLERVLAFRREARDLEILAFKVALDYKLFDATSKIDEELEINRLFLPARQQCLDTNRKAAQAFENEAEGSKGFFAFHTGRVAEVSLELDVLQRQEVLVRKRHAASRDFQETYRKKHAEPGNAHNYAERHARLKKLIVQDVRECCAKAMAIKDGLKIIWGVDMPPPSPESEGFVDALVDWNRDVVRFLESIGQYQLAFDIVIPLCQPWLPGGRSVLRPDEVSKSFAATNDSKGVKLTFALTREHFFERNVRVRAFGMSYGNEIDIVPDSGSDRNATKDSYARLRAQVTAPAQEGVTGTKHRQPVALLGTVGLYGGTSGVDMFDSSVMVNISPFGDWNLEIAPFAVWKDGSAQSVANGIQGTAPIQDLKLHFKVFECGKASHEFR